MESAPLFAEIADGPDGGEAWWLTADDGVRIRVGAWAKDAPKGTVLLFPGRTEYIEKYGRTAAHLARRGYATLAIDWRGQGIADRLVSDAMAGHVLDFNDYQRDVAAMISAARELDLPKPWHLLAHSMGAVSGCGRCWTVCPSPPARFPRRCGAFRCRRPCARLRGRFPGADGGLAWDIWWHRAPRRKAMC